MESRPLKAIDLLRHELKALRYILDHLHDGKLKGAALPQRDDFQSAQTRLIYEEIVNAPTREAAEQRIAALDLDEIDVESFLQLSGEHYYAYPALVRERAAAIRRGALKVETA
ncbi:MAG TPA: hypothetical protein VFB15_06690 [Candidatus Binataceae bacterium]|nr:hypothetical protein [Candidatus Binataceae bacterium]